MQSRIFDMFVQGDQISKADERGFEIGLSLVKRLLEMHGGNIGVHGEGINRGGEVSSVCDCRSLSIRLKS